MSISETQSKIERWIRVATWIALFYCAYTLWLADKRLDKAIESLEKRK